MLFRYYGIGNVGIDAIETFKKTHSCGYICKTLNLPPVLPNGMYTIVFTKKIGLNCL